MFRRPQTQRDVASTFSQMKGKDARRHGQVAARWAGAVPAASLPARGEEVLGN